MIFGTVPLDEALGCVLAHTQRLKGVVLKKGSVLDEAAIAALRTVGRSEVVAARLEQGDVPENEAADRVANVLVGNLVVRSRAATGRVNLLAEAPGLLRVDTARVDRINLIDESLTLGTLPDYAVVAPREIVATIKVNPFAMPGTLVQAIEDIARQAPALTLHPFRPLTVGLVMTTLPGLKPSILDKTAEATEARVASLTGTLLPPLRCAHEETAIAAALEELKAHDPDILLVSGASAVVDRHDVGPSGIVRAGGEILHFGMPVDPGNLICLGRIGPRPALVLPGCARSPKLNGIDFVLSRLFAGLPVTGADIARLGVGGLLKDIEARPLPREKAASGVAPSPATPRRRPTVAAVVLAAGRSRRMAPHNKLLIPDASGRTMVARVVDNVLQSTARPVIVVLGHQADEVRHTLADRPVRFVQAPDYADGLSASLRAGLAVLPEDVAAALVCLGDMPLVTGAMLDRLIAAYDPDEGRTIALPTFHGKQGNPMLWDRRYFPAMMRLTGDSGARHLLGENLDQAVEVEMGDDAVLRDFDTADTLATLPGATLPGATLPG